MVTFVCEIYGGEFDGEMIAMPNRPSDIRKAVVDVTPMAVLEDEPDPFLPAPEVLIFRRASLYMPGRGVRTVYVDPRIEFAKHIP